MGESLMGRVSGGKCEEGDREQRERKREGVERVKM